MEIDESAVFSAADKAELRGVLGLKDDELEEALEGIALAALAEYGRCSSPAGRRSEPTRCSSTGSTS